MPSPPDPHAAVLQLSRASFSTCEIAWRYQRVSIKYRASSALPDTEHMGYIASRNSSSELEDPLGLVIAAITVQCT